MDDTTELYCDNCGDSTLKVEMHHYDSLPWPIESANEGESGSVCKACITDLTSEHEERPVMTLREEALKDYNDAAIAALDKLTEAKAAYEDAHTRRMAAYDAYDAEIYRNNKERL